MLEKRKKRKVRTKRSWIVDIPISVCIFFVAAGIIIGNIFVIRTWHEGKLIGKNEAISVSATFDSYTLHHSPKGSLNEVGIYFSDYEKLYMDGACFNIDVESALDTLQSGDKIELLLHPNSNYIWEMKCDKTVILSFEDAKTRIRSDNIAFSAILGTFGYLCTGLGVVSLLLQFKERRRKLQSQYYSKK